MTAKRMIYLTKQLANSNTFVDFANALRQISNLSVHLVPALPDEACHLDRTRRFCKVLQGIPDHRKKCCELDLSLQTESQERPRTRTCFAGLCEAAVPIRLGTITFAIIRTGEISLSTTTPRSFSLIKEQLGSIDSATLLLLERYYFQVPTFSWRVYNENIRLLTVFAAQLSALAALVPEPKIELEPKEIVRARRFIEENCQEPIRLKQVAKAVNMSEFYFCRNFQKHTGTTFSDYVSRMRLEKAHRLLCETQKRISEVAFEVGFQSLSQFNRSFRRFYGCSPKTLRAVSKFQETPK